MAFNVKSTKSKRMADPSVTVDSDSISDVDPTTTQAVDGIPNEVVFDNAGTGSNVVATQPWVCKVLKGFWNWTKFFATQSMQVAGPLHADRVSTNELKTNDAYATKLTLIDPNGRPGVVYINEQGELKIDYDYQNVYVYPGNGDLEIKKFVYRTDDIAANFLGLTPYETFLNFVPFESMTQTELNGRICQKLCQADGSEELVDHTLLITCNQLKRISSVKIVDSDGDLLTSIMLPTGNTIRMLTINMPSFKRNGSSGESAKVQLAAGANGTQPLSFMPFVPPFLKPPICPIHNSPFVPPVFTPPSDDLFDDDGKETYDDLFNDDDLFAPAPQQAQGQSEEIPQQDYEVVYENYGTDTYCNVVLRRNSFQKNVQQYLVIETENA